METLVGVIGEDKLDKSSGRTTGFIGGHRGRSVLGSGPIQKGLRVGGSVYVGKVCLCPLTDVTGGTWFRLSCGTVRRHS